MALPDNSGFARLIHQILVIEKKQPLQHIADRLGMAYPTLYARVKGRVAFSAEEIKQLIRELGDIRLVDYLLEGSDLLAVKIPRYRACIQDREQQLHAAVTAVKEAALMLDSLEQDELEKDRYMERLQIHLTEAERALAGVRAGLPSAAAIGM